MDPNNGQQTQQQFMPYGAFLATQQRDYDPNIFKMIAELVDARYRADIDSKAREFEIARVYNKLEIDIYEMSTYSLSPDKRAELEKMTESAQSGGQNSTDMVLKIRQYIEQNVPDISVKVNEYIAGFRNQYLAVRY